MGTQRLRRNCGKIQNTLVYLSNCIPLILTRMSQIHMASYTIFYNQCYRYRVLTFLKKNYLNSPVRQSEGVLWYWYTYYLLLVAMSPFLHVEGSRTRLGAVVVGRYCSVWYILVSIVAFHLRMGNCSFFNAC